ncbi:hypothetical protein ACNS7O_13645 [Haloferacaceae archaeon DSL9]
MVPDRERVLAVVARTAQSAETDPQDVTRNANAGRRLVTDGGEEEEAENADDEEGDESDEEQNEGKEGGEDEESEDGESEDGESEDGESEEESAEEDESEGDEEAEGDEDGPAEANQGEIKSVGETADESTTVLFLDLKGLDLDLLGLEVKLHRVVLDVFATEGEGNLLGNLLSAVSGLVDPGGLSDMLPGGGALGGLLGGGDEEEGDGGGLLGGLLGGGEESEEGEEDEEGEESAGGPLSSVVGGARDSVGDALSSIPVTELLVEVIAGVIKQLLEPDEEEASGEEA